jgi:hypothetical protein
MSYFKITKTDAFAFLLFIIPIVLFISAAIPFFLGDVSFDRSYGRILTYNKQSTEFFLKALFISLPIVVILFVLRVEFIKKILINGSKTSGVVSKSSFQKDRGYILFTYTVDSEQYDNINRVMKTRRTSSLNKDDHITVRYQKNNPTKAFIEDIFK